MVALGITATSGRQLRSCDGEMVSHQPTTPRNSTVNAIVRRGRDSQSAQIANAAKATASTVRSHATGKLEKWMASVAQATSRTKPNCLNPAITQPRARDRDPRKGRKWSSLAVTNCWLKSA